VLFQQFFDHGRHQGVAAQALARWRHPVASSEALDVLYRAMRPASYCCIAMANCHRFALIFVVADFIVAHYGS
jgi:hypothetical protein